MCMVVYNGVIVVSCEKEDVVFLDWDVRMKLEVNVFMKCYC